MKKIMILGFMVSFLFSAATMQAGEIVIWGNNVGNAPDGTDFVAVSGGDRHSLALKSDGSIVGWGDNGYGQAAPPVGNDFVAIEAGYFYGLAQMNDGSLAGWGDNGYGQAAPPSGNDFAAIAAGYRHSLALKTDGSIVGWGRNYSGEATPPSGNEFVAIATGMSHSLALKADGSVVGWGANYYGQASPPDGNDYVAIAAGSSHSVALRIDGSIVAWGDNRFGQASSPSGNDFVAIAASKGGGKSGGKYNLALKDDGSIVGWGQNNSGQTSPPGGNDFVTIAAGGRHGLGVRSTAICGNGTLEYPEQCDDNNTDEGDGCSALCLADDVEREFEDVEIDDNGDGTYSYEFIDENNISMITVESNDGLIDMQETRFKILNKQSSNEISITNLVLNNTTKSIALLYREMLCAVDDASFVAESALDCFKKNEMITWSESDGNACGETGPVEAKDESGSWLPQYTCERFVQENTTYARMQGFTYTYAVTVDDKDVDGIPDVIDQCPLEDSTGFDADSDGCIDNLENFPDVIENLPNDVLADEIKNSLVSKVENVLSSTEKEKDGAAVNQLEAFKNQVNAQRGKKISDEVADMLIEYAENLIDQILEG